MGKISKVVILLLKSSYLKGKMKKKMCTPGIDNKSMKKILSKCIINYVIDQYGPKDCPIIDFTHT